MVGGVGVRDRSTNWRLDGEEAKSSSGLDCSSECNSSSGAGLIISVPSVELVVRNEPNSKACLGGVAGVVMVEVVDKLRWCNEPSDNVCVLSPFCMACDSFRDVLGKENMLSDPLNTKGSFGLYSPACLLT